MRKKRLFVDWDRCNQKMGYDKQSVIYTERGWEKGRYQMVCDILKVLNILY